MNRKITDKLATGMFGLCAAIIAAILVGLFSYIIINGVSQLSFQFITTKSSAIAAGGGIRDQLFNSFYILFITMLITIPLGVGGGVFMAEYAPNNKVTDFIRTCIEVLSSLPSIVIGMFGLLMFVNLTGWGYTIIGGALALTVFNLPVMVRVTEDAIRSVPKDLKEASLALGVSRWHTVKTVLIPSAIPSIITGAILASGRVFGEAAALLFTAGLTTPRLNFTEWNPFSETSPLNIFRPAETLAVHIWNVNTQGMIPDAEAIANGGSAVLVISVLVFNLAARWLGTMIYKKLAYGKLERKEAKNMSEQMVKEKPERAVIVPKQNHVLEVKDLSIYYGNKQAVHHVNMDIEKNAVTALIGPSGCGKSTFLRNINRMNDLIPSARAEGEILYEGLNILGGNINVVSLRREIGMVFQKPNPFPKSIYANITHALKYAGERNKAVLDEIVEESLTKAALWDEVKDRLHSSALSLSGGQQQRLCIARTLAMKPAVLLLDEPASALDPISNAKIEELITGLKREYSIIIVTHNMQQALRVSDRTAFFLNGELVEYGQTEQIFTSPKKQKTEDYINGKFG